MRGSMAIAGCGGAVEGPRLFGGQLDHGISLFESYREPRFTAMARMITLVAELSAANVRVAGDELLVVIR